MPYRPLINLLQWQLQQISMEVGSRTLQFTPISFDVSFQEIFSSLVSGGTLVLISNEIRRNPLDFLKFLKEYSIERLFLPEVLKESLRQKKREQKVVFCSLRIKKSCLDATVLPKDCQTSTKATFVE
jgi:non-ribosomal peptide synthetase component F